MSVRLGGMGYRWIGRLSEHQTTLSMFLQDMCGGIMPFRHSRNGGIPYTARLEPADPHLEGILVGALGQRGYARDLADALREFIESASRDLFHYGKATYEIVYQRDASGNVTVLELVDVFPLSVRRFFNSYYQLIPWWVARHARERVGIRRIPREKFVSMTFPAELGGRSGLKHILKRLVVLGQELIPAFYMESMERRENSGFDLNLYIAAKYREQARLTTSLGWNQRKVPDDQILEYYSIHRHLKFVLCQALVREHIVASLNKALNGPLLFGTQLVVAGLPTSEEIRGEFGKLAAGRIGLVDLLRRTSVNWV